MAKLTMGQAAREAGLSKTTIWRAVKSGKISATRNDDGDFEIDPAELFRVFPQKQSPEPVIMASRSFPLSESPQAESLSIETEGLKKLVELHQATIKRQDETISDLRTRLDDSERERRETTNALRGLLTHTTEQKSGSGLLWAVVGVLVLTVVVVMIYLIKSNIVTFN